MINVITKNETTCTGHVIADDIIDLLIHKKIIPAHARNKTEIIFEVPRGVDSGMSLHIDSDCPIKFKSTWRANNEG